MLIKMLIKMLIRSKNTVTKFSKNDVINKKMLKIGLLLVNCVLRVN